ncbi:MAG: hypothetical protein HY778_14500 [Betaproteobacteria bacterium]|nr:hypothetical protein [Betaproteobacteria bacterium]
MASPVSARITPELRQQLTEYCASHDISQTAAIEEGLRLLFERRRPSGVLTAAQALVNLRKLRQNIRLDFDVAAAQSEGRD